MSLHKKIKAGLNKHAEDFAIESINKFHLPKSILIIPDGNGRWAKEKHLNVKEGHAAGAGSIEKILEHFVKLNIDILGIWGFSEDNWKRETTEVKNIMDVVRQTIERDLAKLQKNKIKFLWLGERKTIQNLYPKTYEALVKTEKETAENSFKTLALFLDYGERFQLEEFAKARAKDKTSETYELLSKINSGLPLFDMVLRTSGELRLSGFGPLAELAEFVSVKKNLPELTDIDIVKALKEFSGRQRRFGGR